MAENTGDREMNKYVIVEFPLEKSAEDSTVPIAIVSSNWILTKEDGKTYCQWPTHFKTDHSRMKAVHKHIDLNVQNSVENLVNVKYSSVDYNKALNKLKLLEHCESVSETDYNNEHQDSVKQIRLRRPNRQFTKDFMSDCSSDEENVPIPPKFPRIEAVCSQSSSALSQRESCPRSPQLPRIEAMYNKSPSAFSKRESRPRSPITSTHINYRCNECHLNKALITELLGAVKKLTNDVKIIMNHVITENNDTYSNETHDMEQISTVEDLACLNDKLQETAEMHNMVANLQRVGGKDIVDTTRRIMARLMKNSLACQFNWTGKHSKRAFCDFKNIRNLIKLTVRKNKICHDATEDEVEKIMKLWIRNAPDRDGGRSARKKPVE